MFPAPSPLPRPQCGSLLRGWAVPCLALVACTSPAAERTDEATWRIDSVPFVDLGARDDDTLAVLGRPHSAVILGDSLVVVGDRQVTELRVFDLAGNVVHTIGRGGEGPGEFRSIWNVHRCGDSLHVFDGRVQAYLVFGPDGAYARQYRATSPDRTVPVVPLTEACNRHADFIKVPYWQPEGQGPLTARFPVRIWLGAADGTITSELGEFPGPDVHLMPGFGNSSLLPMGRQTLAAIGSDRAYVGTADSSTILTYRLDGTLLSTITVPFAPRTATAADREWFKHLDTVGREAAWKRMEARLWDEAKFPDRLPAYTALIVDAADHLWVRSFPWDRSEMVRWVSLDATGTVLGSVDLPAVLEVTEIGAEHVLGLEGDPASGIRRVRGYRLIR